VEIKGAVLTVAARQCGAISRAQALSRGMTVQRLRTLVNSGVWQRPFPGVFVTHNGPINPVTLVWSAVLYAGSGAVASHETAAHLSGLNDEEPPSIHITVPSSRRVVFASTDITVHYRADDAMRTDPVRRPPMTPPWQTVLDLIDQATAEDEVISLAARACQRRLATPGAILAGAQTRAKLRWRPILTEICRDVRDGIESPLERRYRNAVERSHGLPNSTRQQVARIGRANYRHAVLYEEFGLVVELDGVAYHRGARARRDALRDNALITLGLAVLRYGWWDVVARPCLTASQVAAALHQRGWTGAVHPCPVCPRS
jgi:very-short-patch-repair endonuclease